MVTTSDVDALFAAAVADHAGGRLAAAERCYRRILAIDPRHGGALHRLGVLRVQAGDFDDAEHLLRSAVALAPDAVDAQLHLGQVLVRLDRLGEAAECCRRAVLLAPALADAHGNLGAVLMELDQPAEAAECFHRAVGLDPDYAEAHSGLGNALLELGSPEEALAHHHRAIALRPGFAEAHYNLGQALRRLGRLDEAADQYREAIRSEPKLALAHANLAAILLASGRAADAEAGLRQALAVAPGDPQLLAGLACTLLALGRAGEATVAVAQALAVQETPAARSIMVDCLKQLDARTGAAALRPLLARALGESWARPERLARTALDVLAQDPDIAASLARAAALWPGPVMAAALYGDRGAAVAGSELLQMLLRVTPNVDFAFERLLTLARQLLLDAAEAGEVSVATMPFHAALAEQCFLNDYVFRLSDDEVRRIKLLRDRLADRDVTPAMVLAVACYSPLASLPAPDRLLERSWPAPVEAVLRQQIVEVREEAALSAAIPTLTTIADQASLAVQAQYEDSPYPRWRDAGVVAAPQRLADFLAATFPLCGLQPLSGGAEPDILVAGCGTGRNALDTARAFTGARTLAIDLSRASLGHALRKAREAGAANLDFAQADLLHVAALGRHFDLIEAAGVLHHLADPLGGWRALLAVLRPGGVMKLGLYSALARRNLPRMDAAAPTADAIRDVRQALAGRNDDQALEALRSPDFYSLSGCRDLLFHVQETRLTLGEIDGFLRAEGLAFLGFALPDAVRAAYQRRFPHDAGAVDLGHWQHFEQDHPDTFGEMYQFWIQKSRPAS